MKNLKNMLAAMTLAVVLMVGTANAGTGLLLSDLTSNNQTPCTQTSRENGGIILSDYTGIIVLGFTGIIVLGLNETPTNCGN